MRSSRLPVAAAVRCRSVCRAWNAALASGHFVAAHAARAAAARHPEIVFFSPTEKGVATSFYACSLPEDGDAPPAAAARKLLSVGNLAGEHLVLTGKPCRGLLVFDVRLSAYHVLNLSTGEHVSLLPCETAEEIAPNICTFPVKRTPSMLLPLPRATASIELVGSRSISSVAAAAEHHAAVLEKGRNRRAPLPQSWTGSGWGGGEEMWRRAREVSALAGDVEEGEEMWPVRSGGAAHRRRDRKRAILGIAPPVIPKLMLLKRFPLELSSTGLGFDPATGQHKVVRLFRNIFGQQKCEVCSLTASGEWRWRRCAGGDAPPRFACADDGTASWDPQHDAPILSLSVGADRFGWVRTPPRLASRSRHLTNLDGSLCAVVHARLVYDVLLLITWSPSSPSWSARCRINVGSLPQPIRDELSGEREIVPLCSVKKKILLATSRHKVYAYDTEQGAAEEVFDINSFVDVPPHNSESRLFVNIGLHEEHIGPKLAGDNWLQVKRGRGMVLGKREPSSAYHLEHREQDEDFHRKREVVMHLAFP
ncbi:uncharacterized protein [Triticum aestivum]|uniref:uncharacterized protein n=1 Tax=Triticum aestivum TaxID=4565 RepID=UPI001D018F69|nr:uncharacterized protein LOC123101564 [Triticum aestivum]